VYPDDRGVSGKKLVPQLSIGCVLFTIVGLLLTYGIGSIMIKYKIYPNFGNSQPQRKP